MAGGRDIHQSSLQPLALHIVNSIFLGDKLLTTPNPGEAADHRLLEKLGMTLTPGPVDARA